MKGLHTDFIEKLHHLCKVTESPAPSLNAHTLTAILVGQL